MDCAEKSSLIGKRIQEAGLFTNRFGSFAKSDYETLMFSIYLDMLEKPARDYEISVELGIPESKVRSLRTRAQLLYPRELLWSEELKSAIAKGSYNPSDCTLTVMIEDPSAQSYIRNQIESQQGIVMMSFNPKHLTLPIESYILLAAQMNVDKEDAMKRLNAKWLEISDSQQRIAEEDLLSKYWSGNKFTGSLRLLLECAEGQWPTAAPLLRILADKLP